MKFIDFLEIRKIPDSYRNRGKIVDKKASPLVFDVYDKNFLSFVYKQVIEQKKSSKIDKKIRSPIDGAKVLMTKYALLSDKCSVYDKPEKGEGTICSYIKSRSKETKKGTIRVDLEFPTVGGGRISVNNVVVNIKQMRDKISKAGLTIDDVIGIPFDTWKKKVKLKDNADIFNDLFPFAPLTSIDVYSHSRIETKNTDLYNMKVSDTVPPSNDTEETETFEDLYDLITKEAGQTMAKLLSVSAKYLGKGEWAVRKTLFTPDYPTIRLQQDFEDMVAAGIDKLRNAMSVPENKDKFKEQRFRQGIMKAEGKTILKKLIKGEKGYGKHSPGRAKVFASKISPNPDFEDVPFEKPSQPVPPPVPLTKKVYNPSFLQPGATQYHNIDKDDSDYDIEDLYGRRKIKKKDFASHGPKDDLYATKSDIRNRFESFFSFLERKKLD